MFLLWIVHIDSVYQLPSHLLARQTDARLGLALLLDDELCFFYNEVLQTQSASQNTQEETTITGPYVLAYICE